MLCSQISKNVSNFKQKLNLFYNYDNSDDNYLIEYDKLLMYLVTVLYKKRI